MPHWENHERLYSADMYRIVPLLFFYKNCFGIKYPMYIYMPLNKESNLNVFPVIVEKRFGCFAMKIKKQFKD